MFLNVRMSLKMMIFRLVGWVALGVMFLTIATFSMNAIMSWKTKNDFMLDVRKFSDSVALLAYQPVGSSRMLKIHVPKDCSLRTGPKEIVVQAWGENLRLESELELPMLTLGPGDYEVYVVRTDQGVDIIVR